MIEIHPSIDIETFATKIKNSLQRSAEIEELQSMSEIGDMDFDRYGKVKCRKIEGLLPKLMKMVEEDM